MKRSQARVPLPETMETMQEVLQARTAALAERTALSNRHAASQTNFLKAELAVRLDAIDLHIARPDAELKRYLDTDPALKHRYDILLSIPRVGPVVALTLLIGLPELDALSGKAIGLLDSLAPLACDSGDAAGQRHIRGGREQDRTGIYCAALAAAPYNPPLALFYKRLREAGKKAKVALTALMRKIVALANTLIRENRTWSAERP